MGIGGQGANALPVRSMTGRGQRLMASSNLLLAVVAPECVSRPTVWTAYSASEGVTQAVLALEDARQALAALQVGETVLGTLQVGQTNAGVP